jgi:hypothetical protein
MKKEKKIKLFVNESQLDDTKKALTMNGIKYWNKNTHFQWDGATAILMAVGEIVLIVMAFALGIL